MGRTDRAVSAEPPRPVDAADLLQRIGERVRSARRAAELTQAQLAERSGVSKRMLALIENGLGNASLATLDKIAVGLGITFSALVAAPTRADASVVVHEAEIEALYSSAAGSRALFLVAASHAGPAELWDWLLAPGDSYEAETDPQHSEELIQVRYGILDVAVAGRVHRLATDDAIRIESDQPYSYRNPGLSPTRFIKVVVPANGNRPVR